MDCDLKILFCLPGQLATVALTTVDGYGERADGYYDGYFPGWYNGGYNNFVSAIVPPWITRIVFPDLSLSSGFPQSMVKLDTGFYYYQFTLPTGATASGSYFIDISYLDPASGLILQTLYQLLCVPIFGQYGASLPQNNLNPNFPYCWANNPQ
jgi:hypothetical protein